MEEHKYGRLIMYTKLPINEDGSQNVVEVPEGSPRELSYRASAGYKRTFRTIEERKKEWDAKTAAIAESAQTTEETLTVIKDRKKEWDAKHKKKKK